MTDVKEPPLRFEVRDARLAFPNLLKPGKFGYGCRLIIPPDHTQTLSVGSRKFLAALNIAVPADPKAKVKTLKVFEAIANAVAVKKWTDKGKSIAASLKAQDKWFYHDGNTKSELDGFEGNWFIACGSRGPVSVFNTDKSEATEKEVYSGCYVNALIEVWPQQNEEGGKRINSSVYGVRKVRDGDAFASGGPAAGAEDFDDELGVDEEVADGDDTDLTA